MGPLTPLHWGLMLAALIFIVICIGTAMGALSNAQKNKEAAKKQGLVAFAFCMLGVVFYIASKLVPA